MKHFLKFSFYAVALFTVSCLFYACSEEEQLTEAMTTPDNDFVVRVENGLLHFKDQSAYASTIQELQQVENYSAWEDEIGFLSSLRRKYQTVGESDDQDLNALFEKGALPKVEDDLFATILNEEGLLKIGNTLHKITNDYTFSVEDESESMLEPFKGNAESLKSLDHVSVFENIDHLADKALIVNGIIGGKEINARFQGSSEREYLYPWNENLKAIVGAWSRTYAVYSSVGVKIITKNWEEGLFGGKWGNHYSNFLYCGGTARTQECVSGSGCSPVFDASSYNTNSSYRAEKTLAQVGGTGAWHVTQYVDGVYKWRFYSGWYLNELNWRFE